MFETFAAVNKIKHLKYFNYDIYHESTTFSTKRFVSPNNGRYLSFFKLIVIL